MVLLFEVVDFAPEVPRTPVHVVSLAVGLGQVAGHQPLGSVRVDVCKVGRHQVAVHYRHCQGKGAQVARLGSKHDQRQQGRKPHHKYLRGYPVETNAGVVAFEEVGFLADGLALPSSVAVGDSAEVNVGVGVGPGEVEDAGAAAADFVAALSGSSALALGVALGRERLTLKRSKMMQRMLRKALRKEPPTTLPKFLQRNQLTGLEQEVCSF